MWDQWATWCVLFRDNVSSDITGANLYQRYIDDKNRSIERVPHSRQLPSSHPILPQTVTTVQSILVRTGVYNEQQRTDVDHSHKDFRFENIKELEQPTVIVDNVLHAVEYILERENAKLCR